jgi:transcriptional regulator with XRE-family HTH domain
MVELDNLSKEIGKRVKELRNARGFSQQELANLSDLHRTYISSIERGEKNVTLVSLQRIAQGLRVSLVELLDGF